MRIAFVINSNLRTNASGKRAFGMAPYLVDQGCQVGLILQDHPAHRSLESSLPNVEFVYHAIDKPLVERRRKTQLVAQGEYDVAVICSLSVRNGIHLRGADAPVQILDHPEIMCSFEDLPAWRRASEWFAEWRSMLRYDGHLAVSRFIERRIRRRLQKLRRPEHVLYSPFAAEDDLRHYDPDAAAAIRGQYGKPIILYLGTFIAAYGFHEMLAAAARLAKRRKDFVLVMAGDGGELEKGKAFVAQQGLQDQVAFPGFLTGDQLRNYLYAAEAFVCPLNDTVRDWARSPGKIYMYAVTGRPIVTCRIGEAVDTLGEAGFYYEQGNVESLQTQLAAALDHGSAHVEGYDISHLFWQRRTDDFLSWLDAEFQLRP
jgi:glycosyltransferase involved in cell wall biosynthesis